MKYNDWCAVSVLRGRKELWFYVTFTQGLKFNQVLTAEKAAAVLKGLRSTPWKEKPCDIATHCYHHCSTFVARPVRTMMT